MYINPNHEMVYKVSSKQKDLSNITFESIENRTVQYTLT